MPGRDERLRVVIVGGVAAGMSAATRLRRLDESAVITVVERGDHVSFANCGLPYYVGGVISEREDLLLQTPESLRARFNLDVRVRTEAVAIDRDSRTLLVRHLDRPDQEEVLAYDALVLAPGARAVIPPVPGIERALTLRDVADADAVAAAVAHGGTDGREASSAVVIGAGFIGLEAAENLHRRGLTVTVVERANQVLPPLDPEMAAPVEARLREAGLDVRTGSTVETVEERRVVLSDGSSAPADLVIVAAGVRPEDALARDAGLEVGERGGIVVDEQQRSSDPAIWAAGDAAVKRDPVTGSPSLVALAQTANRHGRVVADSIVGRDGRPGCPDPVRSAGRAAPTIATAIVGLLGLEVAMTGWSEKRARDEGREVSVVHVHPTDHATYYPGASRMSLKLVMDAATGTVLGAQGVGERGVDKRIDVLSTAIRAGMTGPALADLETAYAPAFGAAKDPVTMLGLVADNTLSGLTPTIQWHELDGALRAGAHLIDVRTPSEFERGHVPGALNVPVDELRSRLDELPAGELVVTCQVGLRGHVGARLLIQAGRSVRNLDGGYATWSAVNGAGERGGADDGESRGTRAEAGAPDVAE